MVALWSLLDLTDQAIPLTMRKILLELIDPWRSYSWFDTPPPAPPPSTRWRPVWYDYSQAVLPLTSQSTTKEQIGFGEVSLLDLIEFQLSKSATSSVRLHLSALINTLYIQQS